MRFRNKVESKPPLHLLHAARIEGSEVPIHRVQPVVIYEIIPPAGRSVKALRKKAERLNSLLSRTHIDAVNIPEIRDETGRTARPIKFLSKTEPRVFAAVVEQTMGIDTIVNRVMVCEGTDQQNEWLKSTNDEYNVENLVLVGGESSDIDYQGPSVIEAGDMITKFLNQGFQKNELGDISSIRRTTDYFCGGITIHTRRDDDPMRDEPARLIEKSNHGINFFTSQVVYEAEATKRLLFDYDRACRSSKTPPKRIILSFAPVSEPRDINFLKWLGVIIPQSVEEYLIAGGKPSRVAERSLEVTRDTLNSILNYVREERLIIPLGLNVEHIMNHNFAASVEMIQELSGLYRHCCLEGAFPVHRIVA